MLSDMPFVNLKIAYDSVPKQALLKVMEKCGVPLKLLSLVKSFDEGLPAKVRVGTTTTKKFKVSNGHR